MSNEEKMCVHCGVTTATMQLEKCPMCFRYYCSECVFKGKGRRLCSERCANLMFYGGDDDDVEIEPID